MSAYRAVHKVENLYSKASFEKPSPVAGIKSHRTWFSFCPMGTLASWISRIRKPMPIFVEDSCVECGLCGKACPFQLKPYKAKGSEAGFTHSDCIKCGRCIPVCPKGSLSFSPEE